MDRRSVQQIILAQRSGTTRTRQYQLCTHKVDFPSFGDKARKRGLEDTLKQLESDIAKLEKPAPIFVKRADEVGGHCGALVPFEAASTGEAA